MVPMWVCICFMFPVSFFFRDGEGTPPPRILENKDTKSRFLDLRLTGMVVYLGVRTLDHHNDSYQAHHDPIGHRNGALTMAHMHVSLLSPKFKGANWRLRFKGSPLF